MSVLYHKASGEGEHSSEWLAEDHISQVTSHHNHEAFLLLQHRSMGRIKCESNVNAIISWPHNSKRLTSVGTKCKISCYNTYSINNSQEIIQRVSVA